MTHTCNLRCGYCAVGETLRPRDPDPLPLAMVLRRLDEIPGLTTLSLTGGEPSLQRKTERELVLPLLRYAAARGLYTQLNTNLTLPWPHYEPLVGWVDVLHTSLNAATPEAFSRQAFARHRQMPDAAQAARLFERILENASRLSAEGVFVSVETMLSPATRDAIAAIHRLVVAVGARRQEIHPMYPVDFARDLPLLSRAELRQAIEGLLDVKSAGIWLLFGTLPFFWCTADAAERRLLRRLASTPGITVRNDPDGRHRLNVNIFTGDVFVSDFWDQRPIGNIRTASLTELFDAWQRSREQERLSCRCPAVGCLGPNGIVVETYYRGQRFVSGAGDAAFRQAKDALV